MELAADALPRGRPPSDHGACGRHRWRWRIRPRPESLREDGQARRWHRDEEGHQVDGEQASKCKPSRRASSGAYVGNKPSSEEIKNQVSRLRQQVKGRKPEPTDFEEVSGVRPHQVLRLASRGRHSSLGSGAGTLLHHTRDEDRRHREEGPQDHESVHEQQHWR